MPQLTITLNTSNDAFCGTSGGNETATILRKLASRVEGSELVFADGIVVYDTNGNRVGEVSLS